MDGFEAGFVHVGVALGGRNRGVTQEFLQCAQVGSVAQQVSGEGMAERVGRDALSDARLSGTTLHDTPDVGPVQLPTALTQENILGRA